ncbi:MAG: hypothetical protein Q7T50_06520 [Candidatus Magasanikbacteria bacterium]|nr:hypothetical protein [Candidatus Magasanikbacteria bacterium]
MKNMKLTFLYIIAVVVILIGLLFFYAPAGFKGDTNVADAKYDTFAQCLSDAGAKFYGAFWCPHCQEQKAMFKNSTKLPYIECSTPDGENQTQVCIDEAIKGYPHWKFADGTELTGVQQFSALAEKTNCVVQ